MKALFIGDYYFNGGPSNVNKEYRKYLSNEFFFVSPSNKLLLLKYLFLYLFKYKVVVFSGITNYNYFLSLFFKIFRKKIIYIMHGCLKYENVINNLNLKKSIINNEFNFLKKCDLILCVSEKYMEFVNDYFPDLKTNINYINNGIYRFNSKKRKNIKSKKYVISLIGGNRNIKNNKLICDCVDSLNSDGYDIVVNLFGRDYLNNELINNPCCIKHGMIPQIDLYKELSKSNLFVSASLVEPFGLAVFDALSCGCDILISNIAGATSVMSLNDTDLIFDVHSMEEIKSKIKYIINNSNNSRIISSINFETCSWKSSSLRLLDFVNKVGENHDL